MVSPDPASPWNSPHCVRELLDVVHSTCLPAGRHLFKQHHFKAPSPLTVWVLRWFSVFRNDLHFSCRHIGLSPSFHRAELARAKASEHRVGPLMVWRHQGKKMQVWTTGAQQCVSTMFCHTWTWLLSTTVVHQVVTASTLQLPKTAPEVWIF